MVESRVVARQRRPWRWMSLLGAVVAWAALVSAPAGADVAAGLGLDEEEVQANLDPLTGTPTWSVKFVCGSLAADDPLVRAVYRTAINVHNFTSGFVSFQKKVVVALPQRSPERGPVTDFTVETLGPNEALEIDCIDIRALLADTGFEDVPFIKGFVVLQTVDPPEVVIKVWSVLAALHKQEAPRTSRSLVFRTQVSGLDP